MKIFTKASLFSLSALLITGCTTSVPVLQGQFGDQHGAATHANIQAHAVKPSAQQKANTYIPADPARTALALEKYRQGKVDASASAQTE